LVIEYDNQMIISVDDKVTIVSKEDVLALMSQSEVFREKLNALDEKLAAAEIDKNEFEQQSREIIAEGFILAINRQAESEPIATAVDLSNNDGVDYSSAEAQNDIIYHEGDPLHDVVNATVSVVTLPALGGIAAASFVIDGLVGDEIETAKNEAIGKFAEETGIARENIGLIILGGEILVAAKTVNVGALKDAWRTYRRNGGDGVSDSKPDGDVSSFSGGRPAVDGDAYSPSVANNRSSDFYTHYDGSNPVRGTMTNVESREWYLAQEAKIPSLLDRSAPLETQARQAFDLRNQFRAGARERMSDRAGASSLYRENPNLTWAQASGKARRNLTNSGVSNPTNSQIYQEIINSSQRSRASVNKLLDIK